MSVPIVGVVSLTVELMWMVKIMTVKKVNSNPKIQVLGNRNRKEGREEFSPVKTVSSRDVESFEASGRPNNLDWMRRLRRWFL